MIQRAKLIPFPFQGLIEYVQEMNWHTDFKSDDKEIHGLFRPVLI